MKIIFLYKIYDYLLKIEQKQGYHFETLPKTFSLITDRASHYDIKIEADAKGTIHYPTIIDIEGKYDQELPNNISFFEHGDSTEAKKSKNNDRFQFESHYKYISYYDEKLYVLKHIFFNGNAYLIKEDAKTIERF